MSGRGGAALCMFSKEFCTYIRILCTQAIVCYQSFEKTVVGGVWGRVGGKGKYNIAYTHCAARQCVYVCARVTQSTYIQVHGERLSETTSGGGVNARSIKNPYTI